MTVVHPKEGAVYWEGPVTVELGVTLTGEDRSIVRSPLTLLGAYYEINMCVRKTRCFGRNSCIAL